MKTRGFQDFIDFVKILKNYYGIANGKSLSQQKFVRKLFENICNADIDVCISSDDGTFGAYLYKNSIYAKAAEVLLHSVNRDKFANLIKGESAAEDTIKSLLKDLKNFVQSHPRFGKTRKKELLALCNVVDAGKFATEIFIDILSASDPLPKDHAKSNDGCITAHSKRAVQHFIGRTEELDDIKKLLKSDKPQAIWLHGMGGLGKTQLCRKLFSDLENRFPYLGWVTFDRDFKQSIVNQVICEKDDSDMEQAYQDTLTFINDKGNGLVLFVDNVSLTGWHYKELASLDCHVVITSRDAPYDDTFTEKQLGFLSLSECKKLFYSYYKKKKDDLVNEVVHRAGYLTLAVELLAKTARNIDISIAELLAKLIEKSFNLKTVVDTNWDNDEAAQNKAVSAQFGIVFSFSGVKSDDDKIYILKNMAVLPYLATRQKLLCDWLDLDHESNAIHDLYASGWLQQDEDGYLMHPIISYTVKAELVPTFFECARLISAFIDSIEFTEKTSVFDVFEFAPYAQEVAEYFKNETSHPAEMVLLHIRLANIFRADGDYRLAWQYGQAAEKFVLSNDTIDKNLISLLYNVLAEICTDSRDMNTEGIRYAELAATASEESDNPDPLLLSAAYHNLAGLLAQQGNDFDRAKKMALKAIEIRKKLSFDCDIHLANTYRTMAFILRNSGDIVGACEYMELAIPIMKEVYAEKPNHPSLAITYNNYARILQDVEGRLDESIRYYLESMAIRERNNPEDPRLSLNHNNIAMAYCKNGDYTLALKHLKLSIDMDLKNRGPQHPDLAGTYYNMAKVQFLSGDSRQAIIYAKKSMEIKTTTRDELECRCLLFRSFTALKQVDEAKQEIEKMIALRDEKHIDTDGVENYAECMELYKSLTNK